jgi:pyruvate dehydrogenase E2 component (dihydrolipoamide acetyltransferase)
VTNVIMPRLSDSMEEGTIVRWLKDSRAEVMPGEDIVEIETDKATMTYQANDAGVLEIVAPEGTTLAVGDLIGRIDGDETPSARPPSAGRTAAEAPTDRPGAPGGRVTASPVARRLAGELGVDLDTVTGSGPAGRILRADVERRVRAVGATAGPSTAEHVPVAEAAGSPNPTGSIELTRLQRAVARAMSEVKATVPDFALSMDVDIVHVVGMREQLKSIASPEARVPSVNDMVIKAAALALREHPRANAAYEDGRLKLHERINVGVAVAAGDALVVPVVVDADRKSLSQIAAETRRLAERVRTGQITEPELSNGTFTISNLGMHGVANFTAIVNRGQAAILAVGEVRRVPVVAGHLIVPGSRMTLTLSSDHRILYGSHAAELLARIRALLERPLSLI